MSSNSVNQHVGKAIRAIRQSKNLTLGELAKKISISYQQLQKYEKGSNRISVDKLYEISRYLGIDAKNFFPNSGFSFNAEEIQTHRAANAFNALEDKELQDIVLKLMDKIAAKPAL